MIGAGRSTVLGTAHATLEAPHACSDHECDRCARGRPCARPCARPGGSVDRPGSVLGSRGLLGSDHGDSDRYRLYAGLLRGRSASCDLRLSIVARRGVKTSIRASERLKAPHPTLLRAGRRPILDRRPFLVKHLRAPQSVAKRLTSPGSCKRRPMPDFRAVEPSARENVSIMMCIAGGLGPVGQRQRVSRERLEKTRARPSFYGRPDDRFRPPPGKPPHQRPWVMRGPHVAERKLSHPGRYSRVRNRFASGRFVIFALAESQSRRRPPRRREMEARLMVSEIGPARVKSP